MFEHSVKVPRVYKLAGNIIRQVKEEGASLKSLVFQEKNQKNNRIQALFALVVETVKHESHLNELFTKTGLLVNEPRLDPWLARVLLTEVLWGKQKLSGESKPVKIVLQYLDQCKELTVGLTGKIQDVEAKKVLKPRYVRINTLHLTAADAVRNFQDEGWNLVRCTSGSYDDFLKQVENLGQYDFLPDYHVKVVFAFAPNTPFYDCPLYLNGEILLQDKATCLAAYLLAPTPGSTVLDMCAAPGMKTTHLAAIMKNEGTIYSVEQNEQRYNVLCQFVESAGATCVKVLNKDVATITKDDCPNVDYILLDPSCSGSGINRAEMNDLDYDLDSGRVSKLAAFQAKLLRYALNEFRTATRVVYSTCSLYPQENEEVIKDVIRSHKGKFKLVSVKERLNNNWNNVGDSKYDIGDKCLYARPESDHTSGFFLAMFERVIDVEPEPEPQLLDTANQNKISACDNRRDESELYVKKKKSKISDNNDMKESKEPEFNMTMNLENCIEVSQSKKKDKKKHKLTEECETMDEVQPEDICKKKFKPDKKENKKTKSINDGAQECSTLSVELNNGVHCTGLEELKKKKSKMIEIDIDESSSNELALPEQDSSKKSKKKKSKDPLDTKSVDNISLVDDSSLEKSKDDEIVSKKKKRDKTNIEDYDTLTSDPKKKKKKKHCED